MKKKYIKPELFFENYELSQNIAACRWDATFKPDTGECVAYYDPDLTNDHYTPYVLFLENKNICTIKEGKAKAEFNYCYTNGAGGKYGLFNS